MSGRPDDLALETVAVVGMALRFPGAADPATFWRNVRDGVESVTFFTDADLLAAGVDGAQLGDPRYVKAGVVLDGVELFDAAFFGYTPREAEVMDPAQRLFLECAWEALERAGYDSESTSYRIGVFAGAGQSAYLIHNLLPHRDLIRVMGGFEISMGTDKDSVPTRVSYKLNLKGPSIGVNTACSTSLVAVHLACQSLLTYQSDMVLAGGATIRVPQGRGYLHHEGSIASPDGHCRAFDARARGTMEGSGVGVVVLKRLSDARADGDTVYAIIRGSAVNNDGSAKVGYTAPGVDGQTAVIAEALTLAGTPAETIGYVETHGTATPLGDPVEIEALTRAFGAATGTTGWCAIGSVKTNFGHLDTAAGVAGLIKTVLALHHGELPPSLHFETPNPRIDFAAGPFYVNTVLRPWPAERGPRRAGVSSFGIGGTNAHVVLEEAPRREPSAPSRRPQLLVLSAKTEPALEAATTRLAEHLRRHAPVDLADVAYTLGRGRRAFAQRRFVVVDGGEDAVRALDAREPGRAPIARQGTGARPVVFMFPGQGAQTVDMGRGLYESEPLFRELIDGGSRLLRDELGVELRDVIYPSAARAGAATERLEQTEITQPALFVVEYALAKLWMSWGITPAAMIGHSVGEYVAACLALVFSFEDALRLVATRGRLMGRLPEGAMLAVALPAAELTPLLDAELSLASINAPSRSVASGPRPALAALRQRLEAKGIACHPLRTSHAFHSAMMDPALAAFADAVAAVKRGPPQRPYLSNLTGTWITAQQAVAPDYWAQHLRGTVRFAAGLEELFRSPERVLLEVGPGTTLTRLASQHGDKPDDQMVLSSLGRAEQGGRSEARHLAHTLGRLWLAHVPVDWTGFYAHERRHRVPLPTYPFERQRYWIDPPEAAVDDLSIRGSHTAPVRGRDVGAWFSLPTWKVATLPPRGANEAAPDSAWLVFLDERGLGVRLASRLHDAGQRVATVSVGERFADSGGRRFTIDPRRPEDYDALVRSLLRTARFVDRVVHLWPAGGSPESDALPDGRYRDLYSLVFLGQALGRHAPDAALRIDVVSSGMHAVTGEERLRPEVATLLGPVRTIPGEYPRIRCRSIDLDPRASADAGALQVDQLWTELWAEPADAVVAYRGGERKTLAFAPVRLPEPGVQTPRLRRRGVYLITGGLGGIGLTVARWLAETVEARLVLVGRSPFPAREAWPQWLAEHGEGDAVSRAIRALRGLEALHAQALVAQADVADRDQMRGVLERARARFGPVNGVIHAAGIADGALIQRRTVEDIEAVLSPKVRGTRVLESLLAEDPLDFMVLCSSLASVEGPVGQVAYCAANAFLDAFARARTAQGRVFTVSVDWDSWAEVGMAVTARRHLASAARAPRSMPRPVSHPLIDHAIRDAGRDVYVSMLSEAQWALGEHRLAGRPTLPATAFVELAVAAFVDLTGRTTVQLEELYLLAPFTLDGERHRELHTVLREREGRHDVTITSRGPDGTRVEHATGTFAAVCDPLPSRRDFPDLADLPDAEAMPPLPHEAGLAAEPSGAITTSRRWRTLRWLRTGAGWALGLHELSDEFAGDVGRYHLHPALLDAALNLLAGTVDDHDAALPFRVQRLRLAAALPSRIYSYVRRRGDGSADTRFDVTVLDERGNVLVAVEGYGLRRRPRAEAPAMGEGPATDDRAVPAGENYRLELASPGIFESFRWRPAPRRAPGPGEVEIEVVAAGLNFKEVLRALGMLDEPGPPAAGFGLECAGRIVAVGPGVEGDEPGDDVIAFAESCFGRFTTTPSALLAAKPPGTTFEQAAGIPIAFVTAYHALCELGRLSEGERVLIHAAAGGVGLAAVQVAQGWGARILATAGSPEKRDYLRSLGIEHVFDSRTLAFADEVLAVTGGRGVDVVLNSLSGEFMARSLAVLAPFGRFLEIGKRDIYRDTPLGLRAFERSRAFFAIDIGPGMPRFRETFRAVVDGFARGDFRPLPTRAFPFERVPAAFAWMAQTRHIGKIVLVPPTADAVRATEPSRAPRARDVTAGPDDGGAGDGWIRPHEGVEALRRILAADLPQVLVSTQPLHVAGSAAPHGAAHAPPERRSPALPQAGHPRPALRTEYLAPRNETEVLVGEICKTLLGLDRVGVNDDFFELGGHSLLGVQLVAELRQRFGVDLPIGVVFDAPTVARLSERLGEPSTTSSSSAGDRAVGLVAARRGAGTAPLSYAQQGLWFFHELWGPSAGYNLPGHLRLTGPLDARALERSVTEIVRRHEILRTTFPAPAGVPAQTIHEASAFSLPVVDVRHLRPDARDGEVRRLARAHVEQPFDLRTGPLFRLTLVRLGDASHVLLLTMHHIVADGWSMGIFVNELRSLYHAFANGRPSPLSPLALQYADFAVGQRAALGDALVEAQLAYWRKQLDGAPVVLDLPTDRPRPAVPTTRGGSEAFALGAALTERVKRLGLESGATLFATLVAGFGGLLSRYSGQTDLLIGSPVANRRRREMESLIGLFINTVPLRIQLDGNPGFGELLGRVRRVTREAFAYQDLPFEKLVEELRPRRDPNRNPLVQVLFALQNVPMAAADAPGLTVEPLEFDAIPTAFDLMVTMLDGPEGVTGTAIYKADLFEGRTLRLMMAHFRSLLEAAVADPARPVLEIPLPEPGSPVGDAISPRPDAPAGAKEPDEFRFGALEDAS